MELSQAVLAQRLKRPVRYFDRVESTNDRAKDWLAEGAPAGALVVANEQTRGRGRRGRVWHTPPDAALALSLILRPKPAHLPRLNMLAALGIYDLATGVGCKAVGIKWPNDLLIAGKKAGGVLLEAVWEAAELQGAILGVGVNVRTDFRGSPLRDSTTSLEAALGRPLHRLQLLVALLDRLDSWRGHIAEPSLFTTWKSRLATLGTTVAVDGLVGEAVGVECDGALRLRDRDGRIHRVGSGELTLRGGERAR